MKNFWKNKKVVVTGAGGFIGSHAIRVLIEKGAIITAVVSPKSDKKKLEKLFNRDLQNISVKKVDLLDASACLRITKRHDIILNFAAMDGGSQFKQEHSAEIFKTNVRIVLNMLDAAVVHKVDRFLLMSSIEVYPKGAKTPVTEKCGWDSQDDANGYVWSKRFSEVAAKMYAKEYGLKIAIARPGNVYGPGDETGIEKGRVIPTFIHKVLNGEKIELFDGGIQKKQFIYISDLITALLDLVEKYPACDPVNIAGNEVISIRELAEFTKNVMHDKNTNLSIPKKVLHVMEIKKAKNIINLQFSTPIKKGILSILRSRKK